MPSDPLGFDAESAGAGLASQPATATPSSTASASVTYPLAGVTAKTDPAAAGSAPRRNLPAERPARAVVVGAGAMGTWWGKVVVASGVAELVGVADLMEGQPEKVIAASGIADPSSVAIGTDGVDLALEIGADLIINPTVPIAHHPVTVKALHAGIPVLGEKPVTETLPEALSLAAHAEVTGVPFMVSQSRRFFPQVRMLKQFVAEHGPAVLTSAFFSLFVEHGGFRATQQHPLLRDMGIHAFDAARYITGTDPVAVTARGVNPSWSVYTGDATVTCSFEMTGDSLFVYNGTWSARGLPTGWNGEWRIGAQDGSATWDGTGAPVLGVEDQQRTAGLQQEIDARTEPEPDQIDASIIEFVTALRQDRRPMCEVHENILSFAMVEAAVASVDRGARVEIDELLEEARQQAVAAEMDADVREVLQSWPSVREALAAWQ